MFICKGIIEEQKSRLAALEKKSVNALNVVTSTIRSLDEVNSEIDGVINTISEYRAELDATQSQLGNTKNKNLRILNKFKSLIDE
jgi:uncharacterized coiled-coil DUF342 family protein